MRRAKLSGPVVGQRYGRWVVVAVGELVAPLFRPRWTCRCDCGTVRDVNQAELRSGKSKSCGCAAVQGMRESVTVHGATAHGERTREYRSWKAMRTRCLNPRADNYAFYGGRGITICDRWLASFEAFLADMGPCPSGHTIDRIDNDGPYRPDNCRWAPRTTQSRNRRTSRVLTHDGQTMTLAEWAQHLGVDHSTLQYRLQHWPLERALTEAALKG